MCEEMIKVKSELSSWAATNIVQCNALSCVPYAQGGPGDHMCMLCTIAARLVNCNCHFFIPEEGGPISIPVL